jgi:hypothetical protein
MSTQTPVVSGKILEMKTRAGPRNQGELTLDTHQKKFKNLEPRKLESRRSMAIHTSMGKRSPCNPDDTESHPFHIARSMTSHSSLKTSKYKRWPYSPSNANIGLIEQISFIGGSKCSSKDKQIFGIKIPGFQKSFRQNNSSRQLASARSKKQTKKISKGVWFSRGVSNIEAVQLLEDSMDRRANFNGPKKAATFKQESQTQMRARKKIMHQLQLSEAQFSDIDEEMSHKTLDTQLRKRRVDNVASSMRVWKKLNKLNNMETDSGFGMNSARGYSS